MSFHLRKLALNNDMTKYRQAAALRIAIIASSHNQLQLLPRLYLPAVCELCARQQLPHLLPLH